MRARTLLRAPRMSSKRIAWIGLFGIVALAPPGAVAAASGWERVSAPAGLEGPAALAVEAGGSGLAAGGERGAAWGPRRGPLERRVSKGAVRELRFAAGALFVGSETGLWRVDTAGARAEALAPGELSRSVRDLAAAGGRLVAATDAGVFERDASGSWRRVDGLPTRTASRVELVEGGEGFEVWAVFEGALWRRDAAGRVERVTAARAVSGEGGALDLALDGERRLMVLRARSLSRRDASGAWQSESLRLPPGAAPLRLVAARGRLWIATDAGLLFAERLAGPWRRAAPPLGHRSVSALAGEDAELVAATSQGIFRATDDSRGPAVPLTGGLAPSGDPPVQAVHRAALRHLELEPRRMHELARAVGRAAWLPELRVGLDHERGRDRHLDYDQAFVSGETRFLLDRDRGKFRDLGVSLELRWNLGEAVFHPDRLDVSREARLVAQLRDDVLDEINQLYFERQRVLARLTEAGPRHPETPPQASSPAALRLRAAELAAGIDAWTGGWFSAQRRGGPPAP